MITKAFFIVFRVLPTKNSLSSFVKGDKRNYNIVELSILLTASRNIFFDQI